LFWWFAETDRIVGALFMGAIVGAVVGQGFLFLGLLIWLWLRLLR